MVLTVANIMDSGIMSAILNELMLHHVLNILNMNGISKAFASSLDLAGNGVDLFV